MKKRQRKKVYEQYIQYGDDPFSITKAIASVLSDSNERGFSSLELTITALVPEKELPKINDFTIFNVDEEGNALIFNSRHDLWESISPYPDFSFREHCCSDNREGMQFWRLTPQECEVIFKAFDFKRGEPL